VPRDHDRINYELEEPTTPRRPARTSPPNDADADKILAYLDAHPDWQLGEVVNTMYPGSRRAGLRVQLPGDAGRSGCPGSLPDVTAESLASVAACCRDPVASLGRSRPGTGFIAFGGTVTVVMLLMAGVNLV
jgi:hypothetical protein